MYLRATKTELEATGESAEGMAETTSKLRASLYALSHQKVDILDSNGNYKSTFAIIKEMGAAWSEMSDQEHSAALELMGGKRNANAVAALIENYKELDEVMNALETDSNSAEVENSKFLDSVQGKLSRFQATFQSFSSDVLDSGVVKGFIDMGTAALDFADGLVKAGDAMPTIATALSVVASMTNTKAGVNMPTYATGIAA